MCVPDKGRPISVPTAMTSTVATCVKKVALGAKRVMRVPTVNITRLPKTIIPTAFSEGRKAEAKKYLDRLFLDEVEIDSLRRTIFEELTEGSLPSKYREALMGLIEHIDVMADHVKDSARSLEILMETKVPKEILDAFVGIARNLVTCAAAMHETIETLGVDPIRVKGLADKVESIEDRIDDEYLKTKSLLIKYAEGVNPVVLMISKDLVEFMERAADICADIADHLRILAVD